MDIVERYKAYADAFEKTCEDDDWSRIEPYFTETATYDSGQQLAEGREAVVKTLKQGIDEFDRKMDTRRVEIFNVVAADHEVRADWTATFTKAGLPKLMIHGREFARFEGDRIASLRDEFEPAMVEHLTAWMAKYAGSL